MTAKETFIKELVRYLVKNQATKSIGVELGNPAFCEWVTLRELTPLRGYPTVEEATIIITEFLR